jgi:hypothetical protein
VDNERQKKLSPSTPPQGGQKRVPKSAG